MCVFIFVLWSPSFKKKINFVCGEKNEDMVEYVMFRVEEEEKEGRRKGKKC